VPAATDAMTPPTDGADAEPTDDEVVETAAAAAEDLVFSRLDSAAVADYDVTVTFEDGVLEVDVYVEAPDADDDPERVADDAALAARGAVDDLFGE
jgi:hypothetical protein